MTIATLTGENGILNQAGKAKEQTEKADIIERAKIEIVGVQSENNGELPKEEAILKTLKMIQERMVGVQWLIVNDKWLMK